MSLVDSHCHLDGRQFAQDREAVIERARAAGVRWLMAIGTGDGPPDLQAAVRLAESYPFIFATVGVHPHDAQKFVPETAGELASLCKHPKVLALGEIGLDYHYDFAPRDTQQTVFVRQMGCAMEAGKPIVIHTREAWQDTTALIREHFLASGLPGIFHCFSEGPDQMKEAVDMGFYVGFTGMVTYLKNQDVQEAAREIPLDRMLVETDCPYLAPIPFRGKRNEPS